MIVVSQLVRLSNVLVTFGLTAENILLPFLYIIVPFLSIIIPMSYIFSTMISFSRLSMDGEYTALLAAGVSFARMLTPVLAIGAVLYVVGYQCATHLEAWGRREFVQFIFKKTQTEIDNMVRFKIQDGVFVNDFLDYMLYTEKVSANRQTFTNVILAPQKDSGSLFVLTAPLMKITGAVATGNMQMVFFHGMAFSYNTKDRQNSAVLEFEQSEVDILKVFQERILGEESAKDDYRSYTAAQLDTYLATLAKENPEHKDFLKGDFLRHSRRANPFVVFAFGIFGMVLGIQDPRQSKNRSYIGAILAVIAAFVLMMMCRGLAEKGNMGILSAAWGPQALILALACFGAWQRHRLPPSESIFTWSAGQSKS